MKSKTRNYDDTHVHLNSRDDQSFKSVDPTLQHSESVEGFSPNSADERESLASSTKSRDSRSNSSIDQADEPSFIDTFAAAEDLIRFQQPRLQSFFALIAAELRLTKKAVFASIGLTISIGLLGAMIWLIINALAVNLLVQVGISISLSLIVLLLANGFILWILYRELQKCVDKIGLSQTLDFLQNDGESS